MTVSEQAKREEKAWLEDSECQVWLLELKGAGDVGASLGKAARNLGGQQVVLSSAEDQLLGLQYIRFFGRASRVCWVV
jgi:hypothetical protein